MMKASTNAPIWSVIRNDRYGIPESPLISKWREEGRLEGKEEGQLQLVLRLLTHRYGPLGAVLTADIEALTAAQVLDLAAALLDFTSRDDLEQWLLQHG
ncbi:DUF4351 domain-containing protein [Candidatus Viridilinea mediisalina]|nr:DUF4351 domain-containing protein [Candidatus Viridilinea mediisalina]